jgi:uncharacterized damage-inducible protein DinB
VNLHADLNRTIEGASREALDWKPAEDSNSLAVLASHVAGSERYWIGEVAGGQRVGRDRADSRAQEFLAEGLEATDLIARLDAALHHAQ